MRMEMIPFGTIVTGNSAFDCFIGHENRTIGLKTMFIGPIL